MEATFPDRGRLAAAPGLLGYLLEAIYCGMKSLEHLQRHSEEGPGWQVLGRLSTISACLPACRQPVLEGQPPPGGPLECCGVEWSLPGFADS